MDDEGLRATWAYVGRQARSRGEIGLELPLIAGLNLNEIEGTERFAEAVVPVVSGAGVR